MMKHQTPQERAALLRAAAGGKQSISLATAAKALGGVTPGHAMAVIKALLLDGVSIPLPQDYTPNMKKTETARRKRAATMQAPPGERLRKQFGQPVRPEPED